MEYFKNSAPLSDVIFDEDLKNTYNFNLRKNDISKQICTAIAYLHAQSNPIIHRDLKPENVLINLNGLVKICDFGLSRFSITIASLRTTVGSKIMGTIMYMAPEILIDREEASLKSEIWSLACILWEIFNENSIWEVNDQEELEEKYRNKEVPSMINIPEELQPCLQQCFSYESSYRPLAADILNSINKSNALSWICITDLRILIYDKLLFS
ncbi:probable cell division protein kinase ECU08_0230 [Nasonia vitripennis]|uniref:Protein kinase domain-containing protein n=1 Tax=Nasonia vitripennis TaxID=7425 RepID=A0A7M7QM42_NASVI|nr:probable cell division protein kinase ECU08_0230 [Nasonia vitripennis]